MLIFSFRILIAITLVITQIIVIAQPEQNSTASVSGRAHDTLGKPIKSAVIRVYQGGKFIAETTADEQGSFDFAELATGIYTFKVARKSGYGNSKSLDREITLRPGQNHIVDLVALNIPDHWPPLKSSISGVLTQSDQVPIAGARVRLINPFYQQAIKEEITGKDGRYRFAIDMQGQYVIQAFYPGFTVVSKNILALGEQYSIDITLNKIP